MAVATKTWSEFLKCIEEQCSRIEYANWLAPIHCLSLSHRGLTLEVPNIFVQEYLLENYKEVLAAFFPTNGKGEPLISFVFPKEKGHTPLSPTIRREEMPKPLFNEAYTFENFIEGPSNRFIKSAAMGVASHPGSSYNPFFIHGGVGLGKTHLLQAIGHQIAKQGGRRRMQMTTTEEFINLLIHHLRNKSVDAMKRSYRSLDVLLIDDIQFLQKCPNFEEELCNTFESLINRGKQIVITSDKPPGELTLSERVVGRMEWGLVAHIGKPDLETRVAILQNKAEEKGIELSSSLAFYIAERIHQNVRQLEGAINCLSAHCRLMHLTPSREIVDRALGQLFQMPSRKKITSDRILESVASMYNVRTSDLRGKSRTKEIALPRHVAMYLAKELLGDSLANIASSFGKKTHSTLLHAWKKISKQIECDTLLCRQVQMIRHHVEH